MAWTIKGKAGSTLNGGERTLAELGIVKCDLIFRNGAADTLSWTALMTSATGGGVIIPDFKQQVEIFYNGARRFIGYVSGVRTGMKSVQVQVSNVWWLMEQEDLTSAVTDDNGDTTTRHKYVAAKAALNVQITNVIYRAAEIGLPVLVGGVGAMFPNTRTTLAKMSCAQGLLKLMERCPDTVTRFDYSGASGTSPWLQVWRRGGSDAMPSLGYTLGTSPIERDKADLQMRGELKVSRVEIHYLDRHPTTGRIRFQTQANGTAALGETQRVTLAGDEMVAYMPKNEYETHQIQTVSNMTTFVNAAESSLLAVKAQYGSGVSVAVATGSTYTWWWSYTTSSTGTVTPDQENGTASAGTISPIFTNTGGRVINTSGKNFIITQTPPEWVAKLPGVTIHEGTLTGQLLASFVVDNLGTTLPETRRTPSWVAALGMTRIIANKLLVNTNYKVDVWAKEFSMPCLLINVAYASETTLYKPFDHDFEQCTPDSGMALGMRIAQDWIPWEGTIPLAPGDDVDGQNLMGNAINLAGALPFYATMRALPKQLAYDLIRKRMVWTLGAPARLDAASSSGRVKGTAQDLVDFL